MFIEENAEHLLGEILPENIGVEINGKSEKFSRPIFIFKKYDRYSFLGLPLSTKIKIGSWYVPVDFLGISQVVILNQSRALDYRRLDKKIGELSITEVSNVSYAFSALHINFVK